MVAELAVIRDKLTRIGQYLQEMEPLGKRYSVEEYGANGLVKHSAERLIELVVEAAVDINGLVATLEGAPPPKDYYASFLEVGRLGVYPWPFGKQLAKTAGLRNRLAHEYETIKDPLVYRVVKTMPALYRRYMASVHRYLFRRQAAQRKTSSGRG